MAVGMLLIGLVVGGAAVWLVMRERVAGALRAREELANEFQALATDILRENKTDFLELARTQFETARTHATADLDQRRQAVEQLVTPIKESLDKVGSEVKSLEEARVRDYGALRQQLHGLAETHERLRSETGNLVTALRAPAVRGRWGEMQLRRAVEAAGMLAYCDFVEQKTVTVEDRHMRPDLVVRLPGGRNVVVDAKTPLEPLLDALHADDEAVRAAKLQDYVRHVRDHMAKLTAKAYWQQFEDAPDFVFMFLPGESFYRAALEQDPSLLDAGTGARVILASPTTLITLLRTVAVGWREERLAEGARQISELGRELYERLGKLAEHFVSLGTHLGRAVQAYNQTTGSFERRVLVSARRFTELGVGVDKEIAEPTLVEHAAQLPQTVELPLADPTSKANAA